MLFKQQMSTSNNLNGQKPSLYDEDGECLGNLEDHQEPEYYYGSEITPLNRGANCPLARVCQ